MVLGSGGTSAITVVSQMSGAPSQAFPGTERLSLPCSCTSLPQKCSGDDVQGEGRKKRHRGWQAERDREVRTDATGK